MKVFVVNLAKNTERMASMKSQLASLGMPYERTEAVYGKLLDKADRRRRFAAIHSYLAMGRRLSDGEIGCALSHLSVYRRMVNENMAMALILEDDIRIDGCIRRVLAQIEKIIVVDKPQVFTLSAHGVRPASFDEICRVPDMMCTDGYVITLPAAQFVLRANFPVVTVADKWGRWSRRYGLELYRAFPPAIKQDNAAFGTDISTDIKPIGSGWRAFGRKALRGFGVLADNFWYWCSGR